MLTYEELCNHPGLSYYRAMITYNCTKNVLSGNGFELMRYIVELEQGALAKSLNSQVETLTFLGHLLRYMHNYLSSYATYIDHTRILMKQNIIRSEHRH